MRIHQSLSEFLQIFKVILKRETVGPFDLRSERLLDVNRTSATEKLLGLFHSYC